MTAEPVRRVMWSPDPVGQRKPFDIELRVRDITP
jgi:hypothetical protein